MSELTEAPRVGHRMEAGFLRQLLMEHAIGNAMGLIDGVDQDAIGTAKVFHLDAFSGGLIRTSEMGHCVPWAKEESQPGA